jgi:hypothetical protein
MRTIINRAICYLARRCAGAGGCGCGPDPVLKETLQLVGVLSIQSNRMPIGAGRDAIWSASSGTLSLVRGAACGDEATQLRRPRPRPTVGPKLDLDPAAPLALADFGRPKSGCDASGLPCTAPPRPRLQRQIHVHVSPN